MKTASCGPIDVPPLLFAVLRVFWRAADVGVPDFHHVRPGDAAARAASAAGPHPATAVPVLRPELPEWQRAL